MRCLRLLPLISSLAFAYLLGCQSVDYGDGETKADEADESGTDEAESNDEQNPDTGVDTGDPVFNCDPNQTTSCPEGQKCTVLTQSGAPVYECVPDDGFKLPFEECEPQPATGQDGCPAGFACLPSSPETPNQGLCLQLCGVDEDCELALCTAGLSSPVRFCAAICDPLAAVCPTPQTCQRVRLNAFACHFPGPSDVGTQADACNPFNDTGCAQGFVCEAGAIIPGCTETSCCTALCDLADADTCESPMICGELPLEPQPGLENVGACYVPQ